MKLKKGKRLSRKKVTGNIKYLRYQKIATFKNNFIDSNFQYLFCSVAFQILIGLIIIFEKVLLYFLRIESALKEHYLSFHFLY